MASSTHDDLRDIQLRARARLGKLVDVFADAQPGTREPLLAGIEFERWLVETARAAEPAPRRRF